VLKKLTYDEIPKIKGIIEDNIKRCGVESRTNADYCIATAQLGVINDSASVWVDDLKDPTCLLFVSNFRNLVLNEKTTIINSIFVRDENDPNLKDKVKRMFKTAESYAKANGSDAIMGASWVYNGAKSIQSLWKSNGYKKQEIHNVKHLK
tara:strand:- start:1827 stop:2276 length:450 start_codon:yes stop_codon:yes gene_type:complete